MTTEPHNVVAATKPRVLIVNTLCVNTPMFANTTASMIAVMKDPAIVEKFEITQRCIAGRTEYESLVRGLVGVEFPTPIVNNLGLVDKMEKFDYYVCARNGSGFKPEDLVAVIGAWNTRGTDVHIVTATANMGALWGHGQLEIRAGDVSYIQRPVSAGVGDGSGFAVMALAAFSPGALLALDLEDSYGMDSAAMSFINRFTWVSFDYHFTEKRLHTLAPCGVTFVDVADVHSAFHSLIANETTRSKLLNPTTISIQCKEMFGEYLAAIRGGNIQQVCAAVSKFSMTMFENLSQMGVTLDTDGLDAGDAMILTQGMVPGMAPPVVVPPPVPDVRPELGVVSADKK